MKKIIIAILLSIILILTACSQEQAQAPAARTGAFIGGTTGLTALFEPLSIKEENIFTVFDTEDFPLVGDLQNKGEDTNQPKGVRLRLLGPAQQDFANIPLLTVQNQQVIEKVSDFNPQGGEEILSFTPQARARYTSLVTGFTDITWNLEFNYDYKTHLIINDICFKGDPTDLKVCNPKEKKTFAVSAAPITITNVEQDSAGRGVILMKIDVQNAGQGHSTIIGTDFDQRFDQLAYTIDEPDKWECKSGGRENEARLTEGKAQILCRLKLPLAEADLYTRSVRLTVSYAYKELIQEKLRIKESAR
ncbi:MAG: hypothetical protein AABX37_05280 [Nanoarchaeota archaeon]